MRKLFIPLIVVWVIFATLVVLFLALLVRANEKSYPTAVFTKVSYPTPIEVQPILLELGIDPSISSEIQFHVGSTGPCVGKDYWACSRGNEIWVKNVTDQRRNVFVAHEYMHYIWKNKISHDIQPQLDAFYQNSPSLQTRIVNFYDLKDVEGELFPIECTEVADYKLPASVLQVCSKYLPNRNALPSL